MPKKKRVIKKALSPQGTKRRGKSSAQRAAAKALSSGTNERNSVKQRVAALAEAPLAVCESDYNLQSMLGVLKNKEEPIEVRLEALQSLQAASFSVVAFESCRTDYIATLREVASDTDAELRQRVLGILAREKDGYAQKKLLEGLEDPLKALVPPEKALQLLSYDVKADAYEAARETVKNPPNQIAKREALRLLAADSSSAPLFEELYRDRNEDPEIRRLSASALQALKPARLQAAAREIVLDNTEDRDVRATSLSALNEFGNADAIGSDEALLKSVDSLRKTGSAREKKSARRMLDKYEK